MVTFEEGAPYLSTSARGVPKDTLRRSSGDITGGGGSTGATSANELKRVASLGAIYCATGAGAGVERLAGADGGRGTAPGSAIGVPGATFNAAACGSFSLLVSLAAALAVC